MRESRSATPFIVTLVLLTLVPPSFGGQNRWTSAGPEGALTVSLVSDPDDPRVVYAATRDGGGVFRSTAGGSVPEWERLHVPEAQITVLATDVAAAQVLYAGSALGRVFRSADRGESWTEIEKPRTGAVRTFAVDETRRTLFIGTDTGMLSSRDGGMSWFADPRLPRLSWVTIGAGGFVYATGGTDVYLTTDGGESWQVVLDSSRINSRWITVLAADPSSSTIYVAHQTVSSGKEVTAVLRSDDGGTTWRSLLPYLEAYVRALVRVEEGVYAATDRGVYLYANAGAPWKRVGSLSRSVAAIAVAASKPPRLYAGTHGGILTALPADADWQTANSGINAAFVMDVAILNGDVVYATTYNGLFETIDGAANWRRVPGLDAVLPHSGGGSGCCVSAAIATSGEKTIYVASSEGVHRSADRGVTWERVTPRIASALAVSAPNTLYAAFSDGMSKSSDGGRTWRSISQGLFDTSYSSYSWAYVGAHALETDADDAAVVHVGYGEGMFSTSDGGESWNRVFGQPSPINSIVTAIAARGSVVYAAAVGRSSGVRTSADGGKTWAAQRLTDEYVTTLAIDPLDSRRCYAGVASGRVYRTEDFGQEWVLFSDGLRGAAVQRLAVNASGSRIYAATAGGVFEYTISSDSRFERLPDDALRLPRLLRQLFAAISTANARSASDTTSTSGFVLPVAGTVAGAGGMVFRTDATLSNARETEQDVVLAWLARGNANGSAVPTFRMTLPSSADGGGVLTIADIAEELRVEGLGSIVVFAIDADGNVDESGDIDGFVRVLSAAAGCAGTVSQSFAVVRPETFSMRGRARALGLRHDTVYRTNAGIVNLGESSREFTIVVQGERQSKRMTISVPPFSPLQTGIADGNYGAVALTVISDDGASPWAAYGSSVDNRSGDAWSSVAKPMRDR